MFWFVTLTIALGLMSFSQKAWGNPLTIIGLGLHGSPLPHEIQTDPRLPVFQISAKGSSCCWTFGCRVVPWGFSYGSLQWVPS